jgi:hypothetical protein
MPLRGAFIVTRNLIHNTISYKLCEIFKPAARHEGPSSHTGRFALTQQTDGIARMPESSRTRRRARQKEPFDITLQ